MRSLVKTIIDSVCLVLVSPAALTCAIERRVNIHAEGVFGFWAHTFAMIPGLPGVFLRRALYRLTLDECARSFHIGFGAFFTHRCVTVEEDVYIGPYTLVASARLRQGCLIGSRVSIVSGGSLHEFKDGRWTPCDMTRMIQIEIGEHAWIGEGCVIIASVGAGALTAAGSVVTAPVPSRVVVGGNPARFIRKLEGRIVPEAPIEERHAALAAVR